MEPTKVLLYPLMGEKATMIRERENKLTFIVYKNATKKDVTEAVESLYNVKVLKTNISITSEGKKKAQVRLSPEASAEEVASKFGVL